jgi:hypothetical protein
MGMIFTTIFVAITTTTVAGGTIGMIMDVDMPWLIHIGVIAAMTAGITTMCTFTYRCGTTIATPMSATPIAAFTAAAPVPRSS